jgi:hypothetical protein
MPTLDSYFAPSSTSCGHTTWTIPVRRHVLSRSDVIFPSDKLGSRVCFDFLPTLWMQRVWRILASIHARQEGSMRHFGTSSRLVSGFRFEKLTLLLRGAAALRSGASFLCRFGASTLRCVAALRQGSASARRKEASLCSEAAPLRGKDSKFRPGASALHRSAFLGRGNETHRLSAGL